MTYAEIVGSSERNFLQKSISIWHKFSRLLHLHVLLADFESAFFVK